MTNAKYQVQYLHYFSKQNFQGKGEAAIVAAAKDVAAVVKKKKKKVAGAGDQDIFPSFNIPEKRKRNKQNFPSFRTLSF